MDNLCIALNKEFDIPIDNLEVYLEKTCAAAAEQPLDDKVICTLKKLSALLWQRYQISRVRNQNKPSYIFISPTLIRQQ